VPTALSAFRIFVGTAAPRQVAVVLCLLLAGLAEGVGLASLLPLLTTATGYAAGQGSVGYRLIVDGLTALGVPLEVHTLLAVVIAGLLLKAALTLAAMNVVGYAVSDVATGLRLALIDALLNVRWSYFTRQPLGRFTNAMSGEAARASQAYLSAAMLVANVVQTAIYLGLALLVSWRLCLSSLLVGAATVLALNRLVRMAKQAGREQTGRTQAVVARLSDVLVGIKPLKAMATQVRLNELLAADVRDLNAALRRQVLSRQALRSLQEPLLALFLAGGFLLAVEYWAVPVGEVILMGLLLARTVATLNRAQLAYQQVNLAESAYWLMHNLIAEAEAERELLPPGRVAPMLRRACAFCRVTFAFDDAPPVLRDVSFRLPAGKITAITGPSGAGKTTIADLLLGLHRPRSGEIYIDDARLGDVDLARWREMVGYVPQEVILLHDSILANVTLGDPGLGPDDARAALAEADASDFVAALPRGVDTVVGERGALLSGGQRQRIAIARALVRKPAVLILDEATSALDPETELRICRSMRRLADRTGLTVLAISHHSAWLDTADIIYRLEARRMMEVADRPPTTQPASFPRGRSA
jgi:ATP-binding cassette, subfamily C, bacterial